MAVTSDDQPRRAKLEFFEGEDGQSYFHLKAANGEIVMVSEGYSSTAHAVRGWLDLTEVFDQVRSSEVIETQG
jgi:uncharacterized protein YegP (UPF0339 family)